MMRSDQKTESIFWAALGIESAEERARHLDQACGFDRRLRDQVEELLAAYPKARRFLESPAADPDVTVARPPRTDGPGATIGPYKLLQEIGEGGMGTVYLAEQARPVRRKVALKLVKPGMDSRQVVARFEAERQALALMDHPNIAKVLDAGASDGGRPYFVMEVVRGIPITEYCDRARLSIGARLELFISVCHAVQHAHQKGIIHRDLKPSNVLVGLYDGKPVPKVIDFGVAKATGQNLTEATVFTGFGTVIGTLEYMSPEQAELDNVDIDTRSDVYALGVLLYELLTGTTPLDRKRLGQAALLEVLRVIREEEPPRPSTRLSTTEEAPAIASNRNIGPRRLPGLVRGELDWVVMKALEKDRNRRYDSADGLAADLRRYLDDEPVQACPPSTSYRLRKILHKHRGSVFTAASLAGLLILGTVVSAWEAVRAIRAEGKAKDKGDLALKVVEDLWVGFAEKWLRDEPALEQTQREFVQKALAFYERLTREEGDDPGLQHEVGLAHYRLGAIHDRLGDLKRSTASYAQAIEVFAKLAMQAPREPEYRYWQARSLAERGDVCDRLGRSREAEDLGRRALGLFERAAADFPGDLRIQAGLADCCLVLGTVNFIPGPRMNAIYITDAVPEARWTESLRLLPRALSLYRKVVASEAGKSDHRWRFHRAQKVLAQMPNVPWAERQRLLRESIAGFEALIREFPREHRPRTELCEALGFGGFLLLRAGQPPEAEEVLRRAVAIADQLVADYPKVPYYTKLQASARSRLGEILAKTDRMTEAEPLLVQAAEVLEGVPEGLVPPWEPRYEAAYCHKLLGHVWSRLGRYAEAERALRKALALDLGVARDTPNSATWSALNADCGLLLWVGIQSGQVEDAVRAYQEVAATWKQLAEAHPTDPVIGQLAGLAYNIQGCGLLRIGRLDDADRAYAEGQAILSKWEEDAPFEWKFGNSYFVGRDWRGWVFLQENRASVRLVAGHPEEAADAYRKRVDWCRRRLDSDGPGAAANRRAVAEALRALAEHLDRVGQPSDPVAQAYRESIAAFEALARDVPGEPEYRGEVAKTRMGLASVLQRAGRADEANALADEALDIRRSIAQSGRPIDRSRLAACLSDHALIRGRTGRSAEGLADLDEAVALLKPSPGDDGQAETLAALAQVQDRHGRLLEREGRLPEAEAAYTRAVTLCERLAREVSDDIWANLDRRLAHAERLAALGRFHLRRGQSELAERRLADARIAHERTAAGYPNLDTSQLSLARFLATCPVESLRDPARAVQVAEKSVVLNADFDGDETNVLGMAQLRAGADRAALASLERATRLNFGHPRPDQLFFRAQVRWRLGEKDTARRDYDEAVRLVAFYDEDWSELGQFRGEAAATLGIDDEGSPDPLFPGK